MLIGRKCVVMVISHLTKVRCDLVDRGSYNRPESRFESEFDYVCYCGTIFNRVAASFNESLNALDCHRFEELRYS